MHRTGYHLVPLVSLSLLSVGYQNHTELARADLHAARPHLFLRFGKVQGLGKPSRVYCLRSFLPKDCGAFARATALACSFLATRC